VTLVGLSWQLRPVGETIRERFTVPVKPFTGAMVIVEVPVVPALTLTLVGTAVIVKSWILNVMLAGWDKLPLVAVTFAR